MLGTDHFQCSVGAMRASSTEPFGYGLPLKSRTVIVSCAFTGNLAGPFGWGAVPEGETHSLVLDLDDVSYLAGFSSERARLGFSGMLP